MCLAVPGRILSTAEVDGTVTVRDRDDMTQERVAIADLVGFIEERIEKS